MRRKVAGLIHRFAYRLDRLADRVWDVDQILDRHLT